MRATSPNRSSLAPGRPPQRPSRSARPASRGARRDILQNRIQDFIQGGQKGPGLECRRNWEIKCAKRANEGQDRGSWTQVGPCHCTTGSPLWSGGSQSHAEAEKARGLRSGDRRWVDTCLRHASDRSITTSLQCAWEATGCGADINR